MALLPWDNWFYHLEHRREEVNNLHSTALNDQKEIQSEIVAFNKELTTCKELYAGNATLVVLTHVVKMNDLKFGDFTTSVNAIEPPAPGVVPVEIGQVISETAGGLMMLRSIIKLGKVAKNFFSETQVPEAAGEGAAEELAEVGAEAGVESTAEVGVEITEETVGEGVTEAAAEAAIEGASFAGLASTGIGIFAAVGIDAIFGAIDGAKERDELEKQIAKLHTAVNKCNHFLETLRKKKNSLDAKIITEEERFTKLVRALQEVSHTQAKAQFDIQPSVGNASQFIKATHRTLSQYGDFVNIRNSWQRYAKRTSGAKESAFIDAFMNFASPQLTEQDIRRYFKILAESSEGMQGALDS